MKISEHNYEAFFLDYHEGNLSAAEMGEVLLFVEAHPELQELFYSFEDVRLEEDRMDFGSKHLLHKGMNEGNVEEYCIAAAEGILAAHEYPLFEELLAQRPEFRLLAEQYKLARLAPEAIGMPGKQSMKLVAVADDELAWMHAEGLLDEHAMRVYDSRLKKDGTLAAVSEAYAAVRLAPETIVFPGKDALLRREPKVIPLFRYVAAAAAILLLFLGIRYLVMEAPGSRLAGNGYPFRNNGRNMDPSFLAVIPVAGADGSHDGSEDVRMLQVKRGASAEQQVGRNGNTLRSLAPLQATAGSTTTMHPEELASVAVPVRLAAAAPDAIELPEDAASYTSLAELAAMKLKSNALTDESLAAAKRSGRMKKLTGWDIIEMAANGLSRITGRDITAKPSYDANGEVTAFAFNAGKLGFQREMK